MTRIIAGRAGGITLDVPDRGTRPTSDRVRESLFGALESADALAGARVVDLYAGSGALGLEAASRGAASVDLVEKAAPAAAIVQRNVARVAKALAREASIRVHRASVTAYLGRAAGPFDLAFLDPPYDLADADLTADLAALRPLLSDHAVVVVERGRRSPAPEWASAGLEAVRDRAYGDTTMWWGQPRPESQSL
ncbi:16S rRNA (guanine(966)-N(2))-methyltransferase RsmD [Microbacterium sp. 4R-513]|uniref:16S rRNA (guanine(966)-N(2))-methyltransferase RsmD n=1 Tax=Microbacterium sp. 4R-513 TaxID=2567934 RepID=UPI0013E0F1D7|nr:16S rRNA (guanine(966)-N(2))-methyltransferase RsmD [Microbacterium sp. 4R-513]QIG40446.1 16S rRNA (guanine(966)-N(2))-methyltransferase RsmD [Microbacterium sp. 4R-513]